MKIGYAPGSFDLFHIGHLNLLNNAKGLCDRLIVGVKSDELVALKGRRAAVPFAERIAIVRNIKSVDTAIGLVDVTGFDMWKKLRFDYMFLGDDLCENPLFIKLQEELAEVGAKIIYLPYTITTNSTLLTATLKKLSETN